MNADPTASDDSSQDETLKLGSGATRPVPRAAWPVSAFPAMERPGDLIGHYKLLEELGKGGFGIVWHAEQAEPIHREVALKVIKPGMESAEVIARFESERQALALMDHPNIAGVLDAGTTQNGRPYFVMELVRGVPITEYCDERKLSVLQRLELFIPVCQAVQHAHQKAILHRDLKPSNILVTEVDGKPVPKVIDFGIAKALHATDEPALHATLAQTLEGMFVGTPQYMSPEQAGSMPDVDTRSDIYTLGVILYELLVGDTPISREHLKKAAMDEVLRVIRESEPRRPSSRFIPVTDVATTTASMRHTETKKLGYALRGDLDWIVLKALEKDRARRYDTANDFALDLRRHLDDEPVSAGPPSAGYRLKKLMRRNSLAFGAAAAILVMLVAGIAVSTWQAVRATKAEKLAEAAATQARENLSQSDFLQALRSIDEDRSHDALAQLARSLSLNPRNDAALCRLTTLLAYHDFALPVSQLKDDTRQVGLVQFTPDGKRIVSGDGESARVWDAQTGNRFSEPFKDDDEKPGKPSTMIVSAKFSPDGKRIVVTTGAVVSWNNTARVWDAQGGPPQAALRFVDGGVFTAQFSPGGKGIVTVWDKVVRVWDAQSGQPLSEPMKHDGPVQSARFSPDGKLIVTESGNIVRVWDAQSGQPLTEPLMHDDKVSAQFSPDGKRIATASGGTVRVWDAQTGQPLTEPMKHDDEVLAQFSPDGKRIVTESGGIARVWDAQTGQLTEQLKHNGWVGSAHYSPNGKWIVTQSGAQRDGMTRVWDAQSYKPLTEPMRHDDEVASAQFSPDGKWIVTVWGDGAAGEGTARVWNAQSGRQLNEPLKHDDRVQLAQFSPDGKRIVTASGKSVRMWDAQSVQPLTEAMKHDNHVSSAQFSQDGTLIVTVSGDGSRTAGKAHVWDAQSGKPLAEPMKHFDVVESAQFSPDGKRIVTASLDKTARVWDAQNGKPLTEPLVHEDMLHSAQFSPDGKRILTVSDNTARVWDAQSGQPLTAPLGNGLDSAQFSLDGRRIVATSWGEKALVWDAQSGKPLTESLEHDDLWLSPQFIADGHALISADGKRIVGAPEDDTARIWDAQSGKPLTEPLKHEDMVASVQFSPDGKRVVTATADHGRGTGAARVWDSQSGKPLTKPLKHDGSVRSAQFSPDGKWIVTASNDKTAQVWDISPGGNPVPEWLPRLAEAVAGQRLSDRGVFEPLSTDPIQVLEEIRALLSAAPDDDDWTIWGRWFLADRSTRTISPFSKITVPEYIENRIKENTPTSLDEAARLAVGNAELLQRIEQARKSP